MLLPRHESRPVPELTPVHKAYKLALSREPVTVELSYDSDTDSFQHLDDTYSPIDDPRHTNGESSKPTTPRASTNPTSPGFLDYPPRHGAPSPDTWEPTNEPEAPTKVEVQVERCTFIPVSSLTPHTTLTNIMEVEIASASSSYSYHPSDAQLRVDEDSDHATGELSGNKSGKSTTLLPPAAVSSLATQLRQSHCRQINGQLLTNLETTYGQQIQTLRGPGPVHVADPSQTNKADTDEDTNTDDDDDEGSIDEWSTKDLEYTSVDGGEHPGMGWVVNDPVTGSWDKASLYALWTGVSSGTGLDS
jgi:hypothetical protein